MQEDRLQINQLLARAADLLITHIWKNTDCSDMVEWRIHAEIFDIRAIADSIRRLYESQKFGDPDYPQCVLKFFKKVAEEKNEELALDFVRHVLSKELDLSNEEIINSDPDLLAELELLDENAELPNINSFSYQKVLDVNNLPDDFYIELQEQINKVFISEIYPAVRVLARKMLENLLIDILRKKYSMKNIDIFYNPAQNRFQSFSILIENLEDNLSDFQPIEPAINKEFVNKIDDFREKGNASAHSITLDIKKEELEKELEELEYIIKVFVRALNNLH